jgi:hypothetical protein
MGLPGGELIQLLLIHDLGTRWGWVVSATPRPRFTLWERTYGTHCTGGWVGPRASLDTKATGNIISPLSGIEPRSSGRLARNHTLYWLSYPAHSYLIYSQIFSILIDTISTINCRGVKIHTKRRAVERYYLFFGLEAGELLRLFTPIFHWKTVKPLESNRIMLRIDMPGCKRSWQIEYP